MIFRFFNKTISISLLLIFLIGLFPSNLFSQPVSSSPNGEIKGFNRAVFDNHFSRADREIDPNRWLAEAKTGVSQALNAWELIAVTLYENPLQLEETRNQLYNWSIEELERRFSLWLMERFFGDAAQKAAAYLSSLLSETQKNYSWSLDEEGNVIFDDKTGNPLVIRPGEENREFSSDLSMWRSETQRLVFNVKESLETELALLFPELLTFIPDELRETICRVILDATSLAGGSIQREFENIAAREERIFTSRRTRDIYSLRKKSEDESARLFTEKLIAEIENNCRNGINELTIRIEQAEAGTGDLAILGEEWLRIYQEQFDKGLRAWEEAEERFFIRRIEWEQDSYKLFSEGDELWLSAFNRFEEERTNWELNIRYLFQSGENLFKNISEDFERNINAARKEFELNMAMRIGEGTARVSALIDIYLISSSAAISSMENVEFWHSQYSQRNRPSLTDNLSPDDPEFYAWLTSEMEENDNNALHEMKKNYDLYASYINKAAEARNRILENYAELLGTGALKDILSPGVSSEDFCLDEYQVALIRAKALVIYWERKTSVAEAVMSYAAELSAGRMTEAEGLRAWENAKSSYNASLAAYETELNRLTLIGNDIREHQLILDNMNQEMIRSEEQLNRLHSDYTVLLSVIAVNHQDYYLKDFNKKYNDLADEYNIFLATGTSAVFEKIIEYGFLWGLTLEKETAQNQLDALINGDSGIVLSLAEIEQLESSLELRIRLAAIKLFSDTSDGILRPHNSDFSGADWYAEVRNKTLDINERSTLSGDNISKRLIEDFSLSYSALLENRLTFELNALIDFLSEDADSGEYLHELSKTCIVNAEDAGYIYDIFLNLKNRIAVNAGHYTDSAEENFIISCFLDGGSFFTGSWQYLKEYYDEYNYCLGLLEIYNEYAPHSSFLQNENWQMSRNSLVSLFSKYGINSGQNLLPDVQIICNSIFAMKGDFIQNTVNFLQEFSRSFTMIPQWLDNEINNWISAFVEYSASYALNEGFRPVKNTTDLTREQNELINEMNSLYTYINTNNNIDNNEAQNINIEFDRIMNRLVSLEYIYNLTSILEKNILAENTGNNLKHWRQYLLSEYIDEADSRLTTAFSQSEGVLADTFYNAVHFTNRLNASFNIYSNTNLPNITRNSAHYFNLYNYENYIINNQYNTLNILFNEIRNAGEAYELSKLPAQEANEQLAEYEARLRNHEAQHNTLREAYLREIDRFFEIGAVYDAQYSLLNIAHNNIDTARFEYEKQDAVQRWAGTAYINMESINPENYRTNLARSYTVLEVLTDLYNGEERRPYENPEYNALYEAYERSFSIKINTLSVINTLMSAVNEEMINNNRLFTSYNNALHALGNINTNYDNYNLPSSRSDWSVYNLITVKDGRLVFSRDNNMTLTEISVQQANELNIYFNSRTTPENEYQKISGYEAALRGLNQRMAGYLDSEEKFHQWSLARDYLITSLINANDDLLFLEYLYSGAGQMKYEGTVADITIKRNNFPGTSTIYNAIGDDYIYTNAHDIFKQAWDSLDEREKEDLEFYVIITLSGENNTAGFSQKYTLDAYRNAYDYVNSKYREAVKYISNPYIFFVSWTWIEMRNLNRTAISYIQPVIDETENSLNMWIGSLNKNFIKVPNYQSEYLLSCQKLDALIGKKTDNLHVSWNDINTALSYADNISDTDIANIRSYWDIMRQKSTRNYSNVNDALIALYQWTRDEEAANKNALENLWLADIQKAQNNEQTFLTAAESYIAGTTNINVLISAAQNAYGQNSASWKNHYSNMYDNMLNNLSMFPQTNNDLYSEFASLGQEIAVVTSQIMDIKYNAELTARETEWNQIKIDLADKFNEWYETAALILENGRADWIAGRQRMDDSYRSWIDNFLSEYTRVNDEWNDAYLAGLEDKEKWLEQAADAANHSSAQSFLSLIGTEGERLSRFMDIREPFSIRGTAPEASALLADILQSSGIINMSTAFGSINNIAGTVSSQVMRGMGGVSAWDSALIKSEASSLAREANSVIMQNETAKLAHNVGKMAEEAVNSLAEMVANANQNFRTSMNNQFIFNGLWSVSGNNYTKEVIKGSTLLDPVITEKVTIAGYDDYYMEPVALSTNLNSNYIAGLNTIAIRGLLENVELEIAKIAETIFGKGDNETIDSQGKIERTLYPGLFGTHIGYSPDIKPSDEIKGTSRSDIFYCEGSGELGRLMSEFVYWSVIASKGNAELGLAPWDRRIWDDEGSWFTAPSLRFAGQIACSIAAGFLTSGAGFASIAISAGIGSASEFVFGSLDVAFGYKSIDEAAFDFGKTVAINITSGLVSGLFNGLSITSSLNFKGLTQYASLLSGNTIYEVTARAAMAGLQTAASSIATTAISGITYDSSENRWGYNSNVFETGWQNLLSSSLVSMTSAFTTTGLKAINSSLDMSMLIGLKLENQENLQSLNSLIGALAGQGVNYALGNDFTLNILNLGLIPGSTINSGILELHLGRDGASMNFGTGGANISPDNLLAALKGVNVWNTNHRIGNYTEKHDFKSQIALRAQYGYGDSVQKNQLWDILNGDTIINIINGDSFKAKTTNIDEQRIIELTGYQSEMSIEDQFRLAAILGHEAYRDGYGVGEINAYGNKVTKEMNLNELSIATIAKLGMSDRINSDHYWFYHLNQDFDFENSLLLNAREIGDYSMFNDYLKLAYNNERDYFWQSTSTEEDYQNMNRYGSIPLFNAMTAERINEITDGRLMAAFEKYQLTLPESKRDDPEEWNTFLSSGNIQRTHGYDEINFISLYNYGCLFFSTKYALEAILQAPVNAIQLMNFVKNNNTNNNYITKDTLLSTQNIANIITDYTNGLFTATVVNMPGVPTVEQLYQMEQSETRYFAFLKVSNGVGGHHFVALSSIDFFIDDESNEVTISNINVANPWRSGSLPVSQLGRQSFSYDEIIRWDAIRVTPTNGSLYVANYFAEQERNRYNNQGVY